MIRIALGTLALAALCACETTPDLMTEDDRADAMARCFEKFENYPVQRNACINDVRTAPGVESN